MRGPWPLHPRSRASRCHDAADLLHAWTLQIFKVVPRSALYHSGLGCWYLLFLSLHLLVQGIFQ
ncbi:hypothetical protein BDZ85DRAFT_269222 [Elsinoe ampelina]|uniref:Uncharacterized protein n=1 Tax=Elsinoe ampelina TaxID=302913 RepID=A0A6A6G008_9PEZI|nr:hypothetical protein BDZ85DRAFT_269222 [Elsinoe ampelina]